jgi:hypothetical protein
LQCLQQPESAAVHQQGGDARGSAETREERPHLVLGEDDGKPDGLLGPSNLTQRSEVTVEHVPVQEEQRAQRLGLTRRTEAARFGERAQKLGDLPHPELAGMLETMKTNVPLHPGDVALLRARAVVPHPHSAPHLLEQLWGITPA